jgi:tetratricopeptide (TPR) repeat protein
MPTISRRRLTVQNFVLIWLDSNINESDEHYCDSMNELRQIVNTIHTFTDADQCVDFLTEIKEDKVFLVVTDVLGQQLVPRIHELPQLHSIYVFCGGKAKHEVWANEWAKVKGVFTRIQPICNSLKQDTKQCDHDLFPISITSSNDYSKRDLNELPPLFMYSQILKEILLEIKYDEHAKEELVELLLVQYYDNEFQWRIIDEFEQDDHQHSPIWWYTRDCFIYSMINRALRTMDIDIVIKMGFFLRDLHRQIEQLHTQQSNTRVPLTVYRGQRMLNNEFEKLRNSKDGLLSFNNFLSTSTDPEVSLMYSSTSPDDPNMTAIQFEMTIDPTLKSALFASVGNVSYFSGSEREILFSMHTIFRIGEMKEIEDRLWHVKLTWTSDDDQELKRLTERIRKETQRPTGWYRLGELLIRMGNFDKAEEVYQILLDKTSKNNDNIGIGYLYQHLGIAKAGKGNDKEVLEFYQKSLEIVQKFLPPYHSYLATTYNNIAAVHYSMKEYSKALEFYQKTYEIEQKSLPPNHADLAVTYNNIGVMYDNIEEYSKALEFYQKTYEVQQKTLPPNHPDLAATYNNIGLVHYSMGDYSKALEFHQKSLEIVQKSLPPNHPEWAIVYNNIGKLHDKMGEYLQALSAFERAVEIGQHSLSQNHPDLQLYRENLAKVQKKL